MYFNQPSKRWRFSVRSRFFACLLVVTPFLFFHSLKAASLNSAPLGGFSVPLPSGNFEAPTLPSSPGFAYNPSGSNWTFVGGAGYSRNNSGFTSANPNAPQGNQVLFLQGTGRVSQALDLVAGYYTFNLKAAQRGNHQASSQTFELRVDGVTVLSISPANTLYQSFTSSSVLLSSGAHDIELVGINPNGGDNTAFVDQFESTRLTDLPISGFETPVITTGSGFQYSPSGGPWTFTAGGGISRNGTGFTSGNSPSPEGDQVLLLQGGGSASHPVTIAQSAFYRFKFKAALRANNQQDGEVKHIRITIGNTEVGEFYIPDFDYTEMVSLPIYLSPGTYTLTLKGFNPVAGDHTGFVDDVRMEMVHDWQDSYVWGGSLPGVNDMVTIDTGSAVALRGAINVNQIMLHGELLGAQNQNFDLSAKKIMAMGEGARMDIGQELAPFPGNGLITLTGSKTDPTMMAMGTKFLGAMDHASIQLHGRNKISWSQLGQDAAIDDEKITMKEVVDWEVGEEIVIVSSQRNWNEAEKRTIVGIGSGGTELTLNAKLDFPHTGTVKTYTDGSRTWTADIRAEVGMLSHNLKIQGDASSEVDGFGGHIMIMDSSIGSASGIELYNMGQKAELGRYPYHWHMLAGVGQGQFFKNSSVHQSYNRALTIHGTESTHVENNFFFDHIGHGVFLEDGSERYNVIRKNVALYSMRPDSGFEVTPSDNQFNQVQNRTPSSYWITNPENTFEDNVAAGTHGTGFWFAFPTSPMGPSGSDPRFAGLEPHKRPLISFMGNSAHSCMSAFDIFDQLNPDHSIKTNWGWNEASNHYMDSCLWYANDLAVYSGIGVGGPVENLIFRNNVFLENKVGSMLASYSKIDGSVFIANSGNNLVPGTRYAYRVYDGAGQVLNSHFVGWDASNASFLLNTGAAIKHPNHLLNGNTTDHTGTVRCVLPDFDIPPTYAHANHPAHPRFWSIVLRDIDGGISQKANTSIVSNQPFLLVGDEFQPSNWVRTYRSDRHYALSLLTYNLNPNQHPNLVCTREKSGTPTEHVYYIDGFKEHHQLPFIVNDGFMYTYAYESLPSSKIVRMNVRDASSGDDFLVRYKDFGKLGGLSLSSTQGSFPGFGSLALLNASANSGYFRENNGDLYIKVVATGASQRFDISWSTNFPIVKLDTDGDEMVDSMEISLGRHPFHAGDLAAEFNQNGNFESWTSLNNIAGGMVLNGVLKGTSINNGDAMVINNAYNFAALEVPQIQVRMKASGNGNAEFFFATDAQPGFSGSRRVAEPYNGNGGFEILTFNMEDHASWNGVITDLRFDVVSGVGKTFEIDWIRAAGSLKTSNESVTGNDEFQESLSGEAEVRVFPNPVNDHLFLEWDETGAFQSVRLLDLQGHILREVNPKDNVHQLEWSFSDQPLSAGVYIVQFVGADQQVHFRLVKL